MAKLCRVRKINEIIFPRLEPLTCLQMLVEIGLDRFMSDLSYQFSTNEFLPSNTELTPFFLKEDTPIEDRIKHLIPIHLALQSLLMINKFIRMASHEKPDLAK